MPGALPRPLTARGLVRRLVIVAGAVLVAIFVGLLWARYRRGQGPLTWARAGEISGVLAVGAVIASVLILGVGRPRSRRRSSRTDKMPPLAQPTLGPYLRDKDGG